MFDGRTTPDTVVEFTENVLPVIDALTITAFAMIERKRPAELPSSDYPPFAGRVKLSSGRIRDSAIFVLISV